jgi:arsenate reductase-like glutaredoxin family protein
MKTQKEIIQFLNDLKNPYTCIAAKENNPELAVLVRILRDKYDTLILEDKMTDEQLTNQLSSDIHSLIIDTLSN